MSDPHRRPSTANSTDPPQPIKRSWWPVIAGAITFLLLAGGGWWWTHRGHTEPEEIVANEATSIEEPEEAPVADVEAPSDPEPEPEAAPEPEVTPEPPTPPVQPPPAPAASTADPTGCTFLNGNRPQVGEKFVVTCDDSAEYLATAEYKGGGVFAFSAFEEYSEPK